jgi:hypothetical protein
VYSRCLTSRLTSVASLCRRKKHKSSRRSDILPAPIGRVTNRKPPHLLASAHADRNKNDTNIKTKHNLTTLSNMPCKPGDAPAYLLPDERPMIIVQCQADSNSVCPACAASISGNELMSKHKTLSSVHMLLVRPRTSQAAWIFNLGDAALPMTDEHTLHQLTHRAVSTQWHPPSGRRTESYFCPRRVHP